jgi:hypothetical protein
LMGEMSDISTYSVGEGLVPSRVSESYLGVITPGGRKTLPTMSQ